MANELDPDEPGTDELHTLLADAIRELDGTHPVRRLWENLDQILRDGGSECLPAPWDDRWEWQGDTESQAEAAEPRPADGSVRAAVTLGVGAAIRSVHQRGHEVALPLVLLEYLTGGAETAAAGGAEARPRDGFEVVASALGGDCRAAEGLRCTTCGAVMTQVGHDGQGWTLARLDLMADRHRCLPRVRDTEAEVLECTCVERCDEHPATACGLSGRRHVHPPGAGGFGPCPVHPDAPGDR